MVAGGSGERNAALRQRVFDAVLGVVRAYPRGCSIDAASRDVWRQLIRSATSVGANLEEAEAAASRADFVAKMRIVLKEARETLYWIRLLSAADLESAAKAEAFSDEVLQLVKIFTAIIKSASTPKPS